MFQIQPSKIGCFFHIFTLHKRDKWLIIWLWQWDLYKAKKNLYNFLFVVLWPFCLGLYDNPSFMTLLTGSRLSFFSACVNEKLSSTPFLIGMSSTWIFQAGKTACLVCSYHFHESTHTHIHCWAVDWTAFGWKNASGKNEIM